jgi:sulfur carrier protein
MQITINGKAKSFTDNITLTQLLEDLELQQDQVVVELNNQILTNQLFSATELKSGDNLELIQFVGGG